MGKRQGEASIVRPQADIAPHLGRRLADVERDLVLGTLARCGGNRTWAADILGLTLAALRECLLRHGAAPTTSQQKAVRREDERMALLEAYDPGTARPS